MGGRDRHLAMCPGAHACSSKLLDSLCEGAEILKAESMRHRRCAMARYGAAAFWTPTVVGVLSLRGAVRRPSAAGGAGTAASI